MSCVNTNDIRYQELLKENNNNPIIASIDFLGKDFVNEIKQDNTELLNIAKENFSEEEASLIENQLNGDNGFADLSNFTCS